MANFAIVVGINDYRPRTGQQALTGAVADACDFADWALDPSGGKVPSDNLYFWTHPWPSAPSPLLQKHLQASPAWQGDMGLVLPDPTEAPKAREIVTTVIVRGRELAGLALAGRAEENRIYVFLAGHGVRTHEIGQLNSQTCFLAGDFHSLGDLAHGLVPCESFRKSLLTNGFHEVFMFLDCCRVQDPLLPIPAAVICGGVNEPATAAWGVGHAAADGQRAFEVIGPPARGAFSLALLEGLRTHRDPVSNALPLCALETFVLHRIAAYVPSQIPNFVYNPPGKPGPVIVDGDDDDVVRPPTLVLDLSALPAGLRLKLLSNGLDVVAGFDDFKAGPDHVQVPELPAGLYVIDRVDGAGGFAPFRHPSAGAIYVQ